MLAMAIMLVVFIIVMMMASAVLEIKLQEAPPAWVHDLLSLGLATPVYKFSKFLTGCCVLLAPRVTCLPHWFSDDGVLFPPSEWCQWVDHDDNGGARLPPRAASSSSIAP